MYPIYLQAAYAADDLAMNVHAPYCVLVMFKQTAQQ